MPAEARNKAHLGLLLHFARVLEISEEVAIALYEAELERLNAGARVKRYVAVIAEKRACDVLKSRVRSVKR